MEEIENRTYDELELGEEATFERTLEERDLVLFAAVSGDMNPLHLDPEFAAQSSFGERIAHGMWSGAVISAAMAMTLPGPGSVYAGQELSFRRPVRLGDTLTVHLKVVDKARKGKAQLPFVTIACTVTNQKSETVVTGNATVIAPETKQRVRAPVLPAITIG